MNDVATHAVPSRRPRPHCRAARATALVLAIWATACSAGEGASARPAVAGGGELPGVATPGASTPDAGGGGNVPGPAPSRLACKRGIAAAADADLALSPADLAALSPNIAWWYNWGIAPGGADVVAANAALGLDYVQMAFNGAADFAAMAQHVPAGARYLLAFNEPNFTAQGNLTPAQAAALWPKVEAFADQHNLLIVSPALNYCGGGCNETDPFAWLDAFFSACPGCRVDHIAVHAYVCYGSALTGAYLEPFERRYGRPLWLTEFSCADGSADGGQLAVQMRYMQESVAALEADPMVFRYAWFLARSHAPDAFALLNGSGTLTELGAAYLALPQACRP